MMDCLIVRKRDVYARQLHSDVEVRGSCDALLLEGTVAQLTLIIQIRSKLAVQALGIAAHFESVCGCLVVNINLGSDISNGGLDHELNLARALRELIEVGSLVDSVSDSL
jgi:hypothetical protein